MELMNPRSPHSSSTMINNETSKMQLFFSSFGESNNEQEEFERYIDLPQVPKTEKNNPLEW